MEADARRREEAKAKREQMLKLGWKQMQEGREEAKAKGKQG